MAKDRSSVSRRGVLAGSLAAPALSRAASDLFWIDRAGVLPDPVIAKAVAWITQREHVDALTLEWGHLETLVRDKATLLGIEMDSTQARRFPEARAMRALDQEIDVAYRDLEGLAEEANSMRAVSVQGAIAKLELSVRIQGRHFWQDHALELAEGGIAELRTLTTRGSAAPRK